jgi:hypothetical protein
MIRQWYQSPLLLSLAFPKNLFSTEQIRLKTDSAASTESRESYMKYNNFLCRSMVAYRLERLARALHISEVTWFRKSIFIPRIQLCPSDPTILFELCGSQFPIKISFAMTISKSQRQKLKLAEVYPPSPVIPHDHFCMTFSWSFSFDKVVFAVTEKHRQHGIRRE